MKKPMILLALPAALSMQAAVVAHFPMEVAGNQLTESQSGSKLQLSGARPACSVPGIAGEALRFDGYSSLASGALPEIIPSGNQSMTIQLWVAPETYPMLSLDCPSSDLGLIAGNYDAQEKNGFAFNLDKNGYVVLNAYSGGWPLTLRSDKPLPLGKWTLLTAIFDGTNRKLTLYFNDRLAGEGKCMTTNALAASTMRFGGAANAIMADMWRLDTFNGAIDDLTIHDTALTPADFDIPNDLWADTAYPSEWWEGQPLRPMFHAMPSHSWMNECHGMAYSDGKYHLFFQKNGNGPYMSRLHWGHVESDDLCTWKEVPVAFGPSEDYDIKGCWSGCIFTDEQFTQGKPRAYYTAVDYGRATICEANPVGDDLLEWTKKGVRIDGRPAGLSDDFRDCFAFRNGDDIYMIVGSSKDGRGVATLHHYDKAAGRFSNDGRVFFQAPSVNVGGTFWEMPNVTKMGDKWLFTVTPLGLPGGVEVLYWVGEINSDGTFSPLTPIDQPGKVELDNIGRDGFGLLSPTLLQKDGKTIAMGIVPDKLGGRENYNLGWAHNISFPREWELTADNKLVQKPYSGLEKLRSASVRSQAENLNVNGSATMGEVSGSRFEVDLTFTKGTSKAGIRFLDNALLYYDPNSNGITVDIRNVPRIENDGWIFKGLYSASLPTSIPNGSDVRLRAFMDGSILEVFVNETYAFSMRLFPNSGHTAPVELWSDGDVDFKKASAWKLEPGQGSGVGENQAEGLQTSEPRLRPTAEGIEVSGVLPGTRLEGWGADGRLLATATATSTEVLLPFEERGLAIVRLTAPDGYTRTLKTVR